MSRKRWMPDRVLACGLAGFLGWIGSEMLESRFSAEGRWFDVALTCSLVSGAIGIGLELANRNASPSRKALAERILAGFIIGGLAGAFSGSLGNLVSPGLLRTWLIGWGLMGLGLGSVEGLLERSPSKLRIGLLAGLAGGLVGGLLFEGVYWLLHSLSITACRAIGFALFGICLGWAIELTKAFSSPAWLTVLDGDRPGRRLVLSGATAVLGRAKSASLSFQSAGNNTVDQEHARVIKLENGRFALEDNHSRHGTSVNLVRVLDRVELKDGDLIRIGPNSIRFNEREREAREPEPSKKREVKPPSSPRVSDLATASPPQPVKCSPVGAKKPAITTTKPPQLSATTLPKPADSVPRGMTRCPQCQRLVAGARPYCVNCKLAL